MDIKRTLESFGYEVPYVAATGEAAIKKALEIMPDLILMDIVLKGDIDGVESASRIKDLNIPVIFLTAHSEESTIERAKLTEPYGYIIKPYDPKELKYAIELAIYKNQMERKLKEREEMFRLLTETLDDIIYVVDLRKQRIIYISPSVEKITGLKKESFHKNPGLWMEIMLPEDRQKFISYISEIGEADHKGKLEYRIQRPDGDIKWLSERFKVLSAEKGEILQIIGHATDITPQKESEKAFLESEQRFEQIVKTAGEWIWEVDADGLYTYSNPVLEDLLGYKVEEIVGKKHFYDLFPLKEREKLKNMVMDSFAQKKPFTGFINPCVHKDGKKLSWKPKDCQY